jgi:hypothetical protein
MEVPLFTRQREVALYIVLGLLVVLVGLAISPVLLFIYLKNKIKDQFERSD